MQRTFGLDITDLESWKTAEDITDMKAYETLLKLAQNRYDYQTERYGAELMRTAQKQMMLSALDNNWRKHLAAMDMLQSGIGLRGYAQKNPLYEYKREAFELFRGMMNTFKSMSMSYLCRMELSKDDIAATEKEHQKHDAGLNNAESKRNDMCPCGSGLKYKHCCGKLK
jgi:preprotein translocase subunit SecA